MVGAPESPEYPNAYIGAENLRLNRQAEADRIGYDPGYTPPSRNKHYRSQYPWDSWFHTMVYSAHGSPGSLDLATSEAETLLSHQQPTGQIFNQLGIEKKRRLGVESIFGECVYGQPPLGGFALLAIHRGLKNRYPHDPVRSRQEADAFLMKDKGRNLTRGIREGLYYAVVRRSSDNDPLVYNIDTGETGRDEAPDFDQLYEDLKFITRRQIPRNGHKNNYFVNTHNTIVTYMNRMQVVRQRHLAGNSLEAHREVLSFNDIEFNCLVAADCYMLAKLATEMGRDIEARELSARGRELEDQILSDWQPISSSGRGMWFPDARDSEGMFYSLKSNGQPLDRTPTIANTMPLLLPNIRPDQLRSVLRYIFSELVEEHGLASVALSSPECDPHYEEKGSKWHGPVWENQDYLINEGARLQINRPDLRHEIDIIDMCKRLLSHTHDSSLNSLTMWAERGQPIPEFRNVFTNEGLRTETVEDFGWTNLGYVMLGNHEPSVFTEALLNQARGNTGRIVVARSLN